MPRRSPMAEPRSTDPQRVDRAFAALTRIDASLDDLSRARAEARLEAALAAPASVAAPVPRRRWRRPVALLATAAVLAAAAVVLWPRADVTPAPGAGPVAA